MIIANVIQHFLTTYNNSKLLLKNAMIHLGFIKDVTDDIRFG